MLLSHLGKTGDDLANCTLQQKMWNGLIVPTETKIYPKKGISFLCSVVNLQSLFYISILPFYGKCPMLEFKTLFLAHNG